MSNYKRNYTCVGCFFDFKNGFYNIRFDLIKDKDRWIYCLLEDDYIDSGYDDESPNNKLLTFDTGIDSIFRLFNVETEYSNKEHWDVIGNLSRPLLNKLRKRKESKPIRVKVNSCMDDLSSCFPLFSNLLGNTDSKGEPLRFIDGSKDRRFQDIIRNYKSTNDKELKNMLEGHGVTPSRLLSFFNSVCFLENALIEHDMV